MTTQEEQEHALERAATGAHLTEEEMEILREVLEGWRALKTMGRVGKFIIWATVTLGAAAAAIREMRAAGWF